MLDLRKKTISGIKWMFIASFSQKIISFAVTIILARLLGPSEFGLFALSMVIVSSFDLFKSVGLDAALILRKDDIARAANTAFTVVPFVGFTLYCVLFFSAPFIARFIGRVDVINIIRTLGFVFVISCFARIPMVIMEKEISFKRISSIEIVSSLVYSGVALACAYCGLKVWSLVVAYLAKIIIYTGIIWYFVPWKPKFEFDAKIAKEMFNVGKFPLFAGVIWFLKMNLDNFLVGNLLGVSALGLYAIAFNIANLPSDYFGNQVGRVTFPSFSKLQNNMHDLRSATLKVLKYLGFFAIPFACGVFLLGGEFLKTVYGDKWAGASDVLRILAWAGMFNVLPICFGSVFLSLGRPKIGFWMTFLQVASFFIFIAPMSRLFGLNGVGVVVSLSSILAFLYGLIWIVRLMSITVEELFSTFKPVAAASLIMVLVLFFLKAWVPKYVFSMFEIVSFISIFLLSIIIYIGALYLIDNKFLREFKQAIL